MSHSIDIFHNWEDPDNQNNNISFLAFIALIVTIIWLYF